MSHNQAPTELEFDQTERITARLRDLVRNYPKGLGLVKEFLQNADDAGAAKLAMIYDRRRHRGPGLGPSMHVALTPSLLFVNDQPFTEQDFRRIQQIGEGGKVRDAARTGRFGQGFNTCYSVTDHPSLLTGHRIAWFDPHHRAFDKGRNAYAWLLAEVQTSWPDWVSTFAPAGLQTGASSFPGTAFRLPLRSIEDADRSEIIQEAFSDDDFGAILHELQQVGAALLVFLRSVRSLEVRDIDADGVDHLRYWISTSNESEVERQRAVLRQAVEGSPKELLESWLRSPDQPLPIVQFDHSFFILDIDGSEREETWAVTSGLFRGPQDELLHAALEVWNHQEKAVPWAGAAVRRDVHEGVAQSGGLACFLPLPESVRWPVWLHGWFDLSSNRRGITRTADVGATTHARYTWNRSLMEHAVGVAWAMLVLQTLRQADENTTPYDLWPQILDKPDEVDGALITGFYRTVAGFPVIRGLRTEGHSWFHLGQGVRDVPANWHNRLIAPLLAEGRAVCDPPMDDFVRRGFRQAKQKLLTITPAVLRAYLKEAEDAPDIACALRDAPKPMLTRPEWLFVLAAFCAEDGWHHLGRLPLALLADGLLHTYTACGELYLVAQDERVLLTPLLNHLLDSRYQDAIGFNEPSEEIGVVKLNLAKLLDCIAEILTRGTPNTEWLTSIYEYLAVRSPEEIALNAQRLKELALVPDQQGNWHEMGFVDTPLIPGEISKALKKALTRIGIPLLHGSERLVEAISHFASKHAGFLWRLTPSELADSLVSHAENPTLDEAALDDRRILVLLLDFLASSDWLIENDPRCPLLRHVRILPSSDGQRVAAQMPDVYIPGGFRPPIGTAGQYQVLDTGQGDKWRSLFEGLGVPTLDGSAFVEKVLLPGFSKASREQQHNLLVWLRDEFRLVERELAEEPRKQLHQMIRRTPILPVEGGGLTAPREVYRPDAAEPSDLLGSSARLPDRDFFASQHDLWLAFFQELDLPRRPLARDVLNAIQALMEVARLSGVSAVRAPLRKLVAHLRDRWTALADINVDSGRSLSAALAQLAWLPAANDESTDHAAFADWPDRLWRANELVAPRLANLVASKHPVLDGLEFPEPMSNALGLIVRVSLADVLGHFARVRELPNPCGAAAEPIRRAAIEVYRYIGQLDSSKSGQWQALVTSLADLPCVLIAGAWWIPERCFFEPLPFSTARIASLANANLGAEQSQVRVGLERVGVRSSPEYKDWLQILWDLAEGFQWRELPPDALNQARQAIRRLRPANTDWLQGQEILVPLADGRLKEARLALVPDDPRLGRMACTNLLPLIEDNEDAIDVARRAGARSLRGALIHRLKIAPNPTKNAQHQKFAIEVERRVRSNEFQKCLRRIAYEEALRRNDDDPMLSSNSSDLEKPRGLRVRITPAIHVECIAAVEGNEVVAFEVDDAGSFLDDQVPVLWIRERSRRRMGDELVRALCDLCGLTDQLRLSRVLEAEPKEMSRFLDEDDVATLAEGQTIELDNGAGEVLRQDLDSRPSSGIADQYGEGTPSNGAVDEGLVDAGSEVNESMRSDTDGVDIGSEPNVEGSDANVEVYSSALTGDGRRRDEAAGPREGRTGGPGGPVQPPSPPTKPGHGSSKPPAHATSEVFSTIKQVRLRSYVHDRDQADYDTGDAEPCAKVIGDAGEAIVADWETRCGRSVRPMPPNNEGYDFEAEGTDGIRYIEVKSIDGSWGDRGVGVTHPQYEAALRYGSAWWLYIVEHAKDPVTAVVHAIQNPFHQATEYRFDAGWREAKFDQVNLDQVSIAAVHSQPEIGAQYRREDGQVFSIIEATQRGALWRVKIKTRDGSTESAAWNPSWRRV